jgi:epoxyqueuosine reductase QueG
MSGMLNVSDLATFKMGELTRELKLFVQKQGADLVGVASTNRFDSCPQRYRPQYYLDDARAVVSIGQHINDGLVEILRKRKSVYSFQHFVNSRMYNQLDELGYQVARFLEVRDYDAYPIPAQDPKDPRVMIGELSHKHAAVAAGLGQIGWNNLFLSPQFGPREILSSVITSAPLEPDPLYAGKVCRPAECGYACLNVCPTEAISKEKDEFEIERRKFEHGKHSKWRCIWGCGSMSSTMPMPSEEIPIDELTCGRFREELQKVRKASRLPEVVANNLFLARITAGEVPWCWLACLTSCPVGSRTQKARH